MASSGTLDCLAKREFLAPGKASPQKLVEQADSFLRAGMDYDALRFLSSAGATDRLTEMIGRAVEEGDLFLYLQVQKTLGRDPAPQDLLKLSQTAAAKGLMSFAQRAEAMANQDGTQENG